MKKQLLFLLFAFMTQMMSAATMLPINSVFSLNIDSNYYDVEFTLPKYTLDTINSKDCGTFTTINISSDSLSSMFDIPGLPTFPMYNLRLELPQDFSNLRILILSSDTDTISISYPIEPSPMDDEDKDNDCYDSVFYEKAVKWPNLSILTNYLKSAYDSVTARHCTQHLVCDTFVYRGVSGVTFTVNPFIFSPINSDLQILNHAIVRVEFDTHYSMNSLTNLIGNKPDFYKLRNIFDDLALVNGTPAARNFKENFLILVPLRVINNSVAFNALTTFETFKSSKYNVIRRTYSPGSNANDIYGIICREIPDYILLIGSLSDIPAKSTKKGIRSDREYAYNNSPIGRWIISSDITSFPMELKHIVDKSIQYETHCSYSGSALLFSGNGTLAQRNRFKSVVNEACNQLNSTIEFTTNTTDGSNTSVNLNTMKNLLSIQCPLIFMYCGKATYNQIGSPYLLTDYSISALNNKNNQYQPVSFGFAENLNDYSNSTCFGEKWLTEESGGVSMYAPNDKTYSGSDYNLSKQVFTSIKEMCNNKQPILVGQLVYDAAVKYNACGLPSREKQIRKYIYLGDPTLPLLGEDKESKSLLPLFAPRYDTKTVETISSEVMCYDAYNVMGQHLTTFATMDEMQQFLQSYNGLLIVQVTYSDNTTSILKFNK